jgi:hypothetical protein
LSAKPRGRPCAFCLQEQRLDGFERQATKDSPGRTARRRNQQIADRDEWRVDDDSGCEVFAEPNARDRAIRYADRQYGDFEEVGFDR